MENDLIAGVNASRRPARRGIYLADIVDMLQEMPPARAASALARMPDVRAVGVLDRPEFEAAPEILALLPVSRVIQLVTQMSDDRAADVELVRAQKQVDTMRAAMPAPAQ